VRGVGEWGVEVDEDVLNLGGGVEEWVDGVHFEFGE
jgi:hypothetical protein